jgi:hydrogenase nickel incorporation protein HypA/HybF
MHELSIAQSVVQIIEEEMQKNNAGVLKSVRLNIGKMSAIVPDSLSFCFEIITKDTPLEGARLIIETIPLRIYCRDCSKEFEIKEYAFSCPGCGDTNIKVVTGMDLSVVEIEVE